MQKKPFVPFILLALLVLPFRDGDLWAQTDARLSKSFKYRSDIDKSTLFNVKKWKGGSAVLHSDWIENTNGKSIDLDGNELFPQYNYTKLERHCDSFYVMTVNGMRGVVTRSGRQLTRFGYWGFDFSEIDNGVIVGKRNAIGTGGVDVYSIYGSQLCSINAKGVVTASYNPYYNRIRLEYTDKENSLCYQVFYPDGKPVCSRLFKGGFLIDMPEAILHHHDNIVDTVSVDSYAIGHPTIRTFSQIEMEQGDNQDFENNVWYKMAKSYFENKKYGEALFCIDFYNRFEKPSLRSENSMPNYTCFLLNLLCLYEEDQHSLVVQIVQERDIEHRAPMGLKYDARSDCMTAMTAIDFKEFNDMAVEINKIYEASLRYYRSEQEQVQRRRVAMDAMFNVAMDITQQYIAEQAKKSAKAAEEAQKKRLEAKTRKTTANTSSETFVSSSSSSSSSSNGSDDDEDHDELVTVEKHIQCRHCKDDPGVCPTCHGTGKETGIGDNVQACNTCTHSPYGVRKCPFCKGRGYNIEYENVRKSTLK